MARPFAGLLIALLALLATTPGANADPPVTGYPNSMAVLGDSISVATDSDMIGDSPANSWSTGTNPAVNSIYQRILAQNPGISGHNYNDAVSGSQVININDQGAGAVGQGAELVTILIGANDVCTPIEASMTPVATFQTRLETAMNTLSSGLPDARIAIGSIPDVYHLWDLFKFDSTANFIWGNFGICQSLLANPQSMAPADVTRRANVRQRNIDFNTVIANVCATYVHCHFDGNAGFNTAFTTSDVSFDYFHPTVQGQALAASVAWNNSYDMTDATAPSSSASTAPTAGGVTVTITATDNDAVSGVEYKLNGAPYVRYTRPFLLADGNRIDWRAVDVNGNSEGTQCLAQPDTDTDCAPDTTDNCPGLSNPPQTNTDGDSQGDACDPDDDNDLLSDTTETSCGSNPLNAARRPERLDGAFAGVDDDGDTAVDEALPSGVDAIDCDGDGYTGSAEANVFAPATAGDQDACGTDAWPADLSPIIALNRINVGDLSSFVAPVRHLNTSLGDIGFDVRWDVVPGSAFGKTINIQDLTNISIVTPPMLGGPRAFNGPTCPWPP